MVKQKAGKGKGDVATKKEVVQAVILADGFTDDFAPLTDSTSRLLLPLANIPLIEYTLECLDISGVDEVYIYASKHVDQLKKWKEGSRWSNASMALKFLCNPSVFSVGDALRDIEKAQVIEDTFYLVSSPIVSNINMSGLMRDFRAQHRENQDVLMTTLYQNSLPASDPMTRDTSHIVIDPLTNEIVEILPEMKASGVSLSRDLLDSHPGGLEIRSDLIDTRVDLCSLEVITLFTDNFDYQEIRRDFMPGVFASEVLGHQLFAHVLEEGFMAAVTTPHTHEVTTRQVVGRWAYPITLESNFCGTTEFKTSGSILREENVILPRTTCCGVRSILGSHSVVENGSILKYTCVGRQCSIGPNVKLTATCLGTSVSIDDGAVIENSFIGSNASIGRNTVIKNAILGPNVTIAADVVLPEGSRITADLDGFGEATNDPSIVGVDGVGRSWSEENEDAEPLRMFGMEVTWGDGDRSDDSDLEDDDDMEEETFTSEARNTIIRGLDEEVSITNLVTELNSLRLTFDATFAEAAAAILETMLFVSLETKPDAPSVGLAALLKLSKWLELITKFTKSVDGPDLIISVEEECLRLPTLTPHFTKFLQLFYEADIFSEESILAWAEIQEDNDPEDLELFHQASAFLTWLKEAEEESDSEESSEEESSEESSGEESD